jgi:spermidine synthase
LENALAFDALNPELQAGMGRAYAGLGRPGDAIRHYRNALKLRPGWRHATNDLAWLLATTSKTELREPEQARSLIEAALLEDEVRPELLDTLAAALAAAGRFDEAIVAADRAIQLAHRDLQLAREIRARRERYARGEAYSEGAPTTPGATPTLR